MGTRLFARLGLGALGLVLTPSMLGDGTVRIIGRPKPRPNEAPWKSPAVIDFSPSEKLGQLPSFRGRHMERGWPHGQLRPDPAVQIPAEAKPALRSARLPDPAVKRALELGRTPVRIPKSVLLEVVPPKMSEVLDDLLRPELAPRLDPITGDQARNLGRKAEKNRRLREKKREKRREARAQARPKPRPDPRPRPKPNPTPRPRPQPRPDPRPTPRPRPSQPTTPRPQPRPNPRPGRNPRPVPVPEAPGVRPIPTPKPTPQPRLPGSVWEPAVAPEVHPEPGPILWPELVIDGRINQDGHPSLRLRTRLVRDRPPRRERDKKIRENGRAKQLHRIITSIWGGFTEVMDIWDAAYDNAYRDGKSVAGMAQWDVLQGIATGEIKIDPNGFVDSLILNQIEDSIIGSLSQGISDALIRAGDASDPTVGQKFNWLNRTGNQIEQAGTF